MARDRERGGGDVNLSIAKQTIGYAEGIAGDHAQVCEDPLEGGGAVEYERKDRGGRGVSYSKPGIRSEARHFASQPQLCLSCPQRSSCLVSRFLSLSSLARYSHSRIMVSILVYAHDKVAESRKTAQGKAQAQRRPRAVCPASLQTSVCRTGQRCRACHCR